MDGLLEISTLGGLAIQLDGKPVTDLVTRKVEALLVYLACTARPHPREVLAEMLWEERTQSQALSNLRVALSNLRKVLDPYVDIRRDSVSINLDAYILLDVIEMEKSHSPSSNLLTHTDQLTPELLTALEQQVTLYQGDFMAGFPIRSCPGFENWLTFQQERVRLVFERKITDLLNGLLAQNRWMDVIKWGEYWIAYGYHPELAYRGLMTAYAGLGDLAGMSTVYQRCVAAFRDELGIDPSEQTRKLYETLLRGELPTSSVISQQDELHVSQANRSARLILDQFHQDEGKVLDKASLVVIYLSRGDLEFGAKDSKLLIRSALHHGVDVQPWIRRIGRPQDALRVLAASYEQYPKPKIRLNIVNSLKGLAQEDSVDLLVRIGTSDDAGEVRAEAAVAAASQGRLGEVVELLVNQMQKSSEPSALAAFVAVADEVGLPPGDFSYPKLPVWVSLARKRWQVHRRQIRDRVVRGMIGGALSLAFFGSLLPLFLYLAKPEAFNESIQLFSLVAWVLSGIIVGLLFGSLQGAALSFNVSIADALFQGMNSNRWRIILAGFAGLVYSIYLITFSLTGLLDPETGTSIYLVAFVFYGIFFGIALSMVIPRLGSSKSSRKQLVQVIRAIVVIILVALPVIYVVYPETRLYKFIQEFCFVVIFTSGMAIAVNRPSDVIDKGGFD